MFSSARRWFSPTAVGVARSLEWSMQPRRVWLAANCTRWGRPVRLSGAASVTKKGHFSAFRTTHGKIPVCREVWLQPAVSLLAIWTRVLRLGCNPRFRHPVPSSSSRESAAHSSARIRRPGHLSTLRRAGHIVQLPRTRHLAGPA
jgi:hypothetical protein